MADSPRYQNLFKYIHKFKPKILMEIGVWNGNHAVQMIEAAKQHHPYFNIEYHGFDLFESITDKEIENEYSKTKTYNMQEVLAKIIKTQVTAKLYQGYTSDTIPQLAHSRKGFKADLIFIDGGHSLETIETDWNNIQDFIHKDTVVLFDDYWVGRTDAGCKVLIDDLRMNETKYWNVELLEPLDIFPDKRIRMVRVMKRKNSFNTVPKHKLKQELVAA